MTKIIKYIYRWLNKSDLKEFKDEQHIFNEVIESKVDLLIDVVVNGNNNPRR